MKFSDFLVREAIITDLQATTKEGALREVVRSLQDAGHFAGEDLESIIRMLLGREEIGTTGLGGGCALPGANCRYPSVDRAIGTIALSRRGINWDALDGEPVDILFFLTTSPKRNGDDLLAQEVIWRHMRDERFRDRLRRAETREQVIKLLEEADQGDP
jgi:mannitol/fructose-specific phosphotransferase system IIA component (Ntr-type)